MRIIPALITFKVSEIRVYPRKEEKIFPVEPFDIMIEPPLDKTGLERLIRSREIEIEDRSLVGFQALTIFEEKEELIYEHWRIENSSWTVDYLTPANQLE